MKINLWFIFWGVNEALLRESPSKGESFSGKVHIETKFALRNALISLFAQWKKMFERLSVMRNCSMAWWKKGWAAFTFVPITSSSYKALIIWASWGKLRLSICKWRLGYLVWSVTGFLKNMYKSYLAQYLGSQYLWHQFAWL